MQKTLLHKIRMDIEESQINWKVILSFIPIAFITYIFHEFGHWTFGELLGNDMALSLNNSTPKSGYFISESHALWSAIGGPVFTIFQGLIFLLIVKLTHSIYAFSIAFFAFFSRFFSIVFGGVTLQDEARIAAMLGMDKYLVVAVVLTILSLILWRSCRIMKLRIKSIGYFTVIGVFAMLIVITTNALFVTK